MYRTPLFLASPQPYDWLAGCLQSVRPSVSSRLIRLHLLVLLLYCLPRCFSASAGSSCLIFPFATRAKLQMFQGRTCRGYMADWFQRGREEAEVKVRIRGDFLVEVPPSPLVSRCDGHVCAGRQSDWPGG